ncbi:transposase [Candidatus Contendibacter odensensis]
MTPRGIPLIWSRFCQPPARLNAVYRRRSVTGTTNRSRVTGMPCVCHRLRPQKRGGGARANAAKKGRPPQARTLIFAEWVLIWTTLPPEIVSTATIMALYRVRWPIERVFKRLKSILNMDHLRARKDSPLAEVYLHGKLLYAWIVEKRLCRRCGHDWHRLDQPRRATP